MSDRTVRVTLSANIAAYKKGMDDAAKSTRAVGSEGEKLAQMKQAFDGIGRSALAMGAVIGAGMTIAVARFAEFDQAMSNVSAATNETTANMALLRQAAIDAGSSTVFSATESANAIEELAKAGVSTADILGGGLAGALDLAAAGGLGVADAAGIAATALKVFNLEGDDMAHVADLLAAGAGKAMGDVTDLSAALSQGGQVAAATGLSIEETTGTLAAFAAQGLLGSDAGTSFKSMLQRLTPQSAEAKKKMDELGISAYDAAGQFIGMEKFAGNLESSLKKMTVEQRNSALATIFGSDAVRAANVLYSEGESGIRDWIAAVDDQGYAAEQARKRLDNLKGDIEALQGAIDSAFIQTGASANNVLRDTVQTLTGLVGMYNDLPQPIKDFTAITGGATAAIALAGGTALLAVPKFLEMRATVTGAGISMKGLGLTAGGAGLALGGLFAIVGGLAQRQAEARQTAQNYADTLEEGTLRITDATKKLAAENLQKTPGFLENMFGKVNGSGSVFDAAEKLGLNLTKVTDAATGSSDAIKELAPLLAKMREGTGFAADESERLGISQYDLEEAALKVQSGIQGEAESMDEAARIARQKEDATKAVTAATGESAEVAQTAASAYMAEADAASKTGAELSQLIDTINEANGVGQDAITSNIAYRDAMAKVDETIQKAREGQEGYVATLDQNTQAGRDNMGMLVDLAGRAKEAADSQFALDNNTANYKSTLESSHQALLDRMIALGMNADEAGALADQIFRIPSSTEWEAIAKTAAANTEIARFIADQESKVIRIGLSTYFKDGPQGQLRVSTPGQPDKYAVGGAVRGPGGPRDDLVPALLSNGEHVWTAEEVQAAGGHARVAALRASSLAGFTAYAEGGVIEVTPPEGATREEVNG